MRLHHDLNETNLSHFVYHNKIIHLLHSYYAIQEMYEMIFWSLGMFANHIC